MPLLARSLCSPASSLRRLPTPGLVSDVAPFAFDNIQHFIPSFCIRCLSVHVAAAHLSLPRSPPQAHSGPPIYPLNNQLLPAASARPIALHFECSPFSHRTPVRACHVSNFRPPCVKPLVVALAFTSRLSPFIAFPSQCCSRCLLLFLDHAVAF